MYFIKNNAVRVYTYNYLDLSVVFFAVCSILIAASTVPSLILNLAGSFSSESSSGSCSLITFVTRNSPSKSFLKM